MADCLPPFEWIADGNVVGSGPSRLMGGAGHGIVGRPLGFCRSRRSLSSSIAHSLLPSQFVTTFGSYATAPTQIVRLMVVFLLIGHRRRGC
jgi:hypothetical protein